MSDAFLNRAMRLTLVTIITAAAAAGLILSYRGLFELIAGNFPTAGMQLGWGLTAVAAALLLMRFRGDLIDG